MNTKTREGGKCYSRDSAFIVLDQSTLPLAQVGSVNKVGAVNVDQLKVGATEPNVQSAISDLTNMYQVHVGGVVIHHVDNENPAGVSMSERLTFVGTAEFDFIECYGVGVKVTVGDNAGLVKDKVYNELSKLKDSNMVFSAVTKTAGSDSQLDITFIDTNPHDNYVIDKDGISIVGSTTTVAKPGYGTWIKIGTSTITPTQGQNPTLYYWKRTA